jgi:ferritin-like metal-binding protein YciE
MAKDQFYQLFLCELKDIYNVEKHIVSALPKLIEKATDPTLSEALQTHLEETKEQVNRLNLAFSKLSETPNNESEQSPAIEGLLRKGEIMLEKFDIPSIRDAAIITIAQRIEHYEMAVYGTLRTYAHQLEFKEVEELLQENLTEEGNANKKLMDIAKGGFFTSGINQKALSM